MHDSIKLLRIGDQIDQHGPFNRHVIMRMAHRVIKRVMFAEFKLPLWLYMYKDSIVSSPRITPLISGRLMKYLTYTPQRTGLQRSFDPLPHTLISKQR
jgi:hypothetical protein